MNRLGNFNYLNLPQWKNEGYCDYVIGEGSFPHNEGIKKLCNKEQDDSGSFFYFKSRLYVTLILDEMETSSSKFIKTEYKIEELDKKIFHKNCNL